MEQLLQNIPRPEIRRESPCARTSPVRFQRPPEMLAQRLGSLFSVNHDVVHGELSHYGNTETGARSSTLKCMPAGGARPPDGMDGATRLDALASFFTLFSDGEPAPTPFHLDIVDDEEGRVQRLVEDIEE